MLLIRQDKHDRDCLQLFSVREEKTIIWAIFPAYYFMDNTNKIKIILDDDDPECVRIYVENLSGKQYFSSFHTDGLSEMGIHADDITNAPFFLLASFVSEKHFIDKLLENKIND